MRVDPNTYASVNTDIQLSEQQLQTAMNQLSSGKRVSLPSDDPVAYAEDTVSLAASAQVDAYTQNADAVLTQAQAADSVLSNVVTSLTQAISLGTEGGNSSVSAAQRSALAQQVQGLLSDVVSEANQTNEGVPLFAGTSTTGTPFVADATAASGYSYTGNDVTNQAAVGTNLTVTTNVPGDQIFLSAQGNVLGSLQGMVSALQSGSTANIAAASSAITTAINHVSAVRAVYGGTVDQLDAQNSFLSQETVSLTTQQSNLVDVDTATAATNLTQAETENSAVLAAAAKVLPQSLLQYLQS